MLGYLICVTKSFMLGYLICRHVPIIAIALNFRADIVFAPLQVYSGIFLIRAQIMVVPNLSPRRHNKKYKKHNSVIIVITSSNWYYHQHEIPTSN